MSEQFQKLINKPTPQKKKKILRKRNEKCNTSHLKVVKESVKKTTAKNLIAEKNCNR